MADHTRLLPYYFLDGSYAFVRSPSLATAHDAISPSSVFTPNPSAVPGSLVSSHSAGMTTIPPRSQPLGLSPLCSVPTAVTPISRNRTTGQHRPMQPDERINQPLSTAKIMGDSQSMDSQEGRQDNRSKVQKQKVDRKFLCRQCGKLLSHKSSLKRHSRSHTDAKPPFVCYLCKHGFFRNDMLERHFKGCSRGRENPIQASHLAYQHRENRADGANTLQQHSLTRATDLPYVPGRSTDAIAARPVILSATADNPVGPATAGGLSSFSVEMCQSSIEDLAPFEPNALWGEEWYTKQEFDTAEKYTQSTSTYTTNAISNGTSIPGTYSFGGTMLSSALSTQSKRVLQQPMHFPGQSSINQNNDNPNDARDFLDLFTTRPRPTHVFVPASADSFIDISTASMFSGDTSNNEAVANIKDRFGTYAELGDLSAAVQF